MHLKAARLFRDAKGQMQDSRLAAAFDVMADDHVARGRMCALKSRHVLASLAPATRQVPAAPDAAADADPAATLRRQIQDALNTAISATSGSIARGADTMHRALDALDNPGGGPGAMLAAPPAGPAATPAPPSETDRLLGVIQRLRDENETLLQVGGCTSPAGALNDAGAHTTARCRCCRVACQERDTLHRLRDARAAHAQAQEDLRRRWLVHVEAVRASVGAMLLDHTKAVERYAAAVHARRAQQPPGPPPGTVEAAARALRPTSAAGVGPAAPPAVASLDAILRAAEIGAARARAHREGAISRAPTPRPSPAPSPQPSPALLPRPSPALSPALSPARPPRPPPKSSPSLTAVMMGAVLSAGPLTRASPPGPPGPV
jgi:hypothetical protein